MEGQTSPLSYHYEFMYSLLLVLMINMIN